MFIQATTPRPVFDVLKYPEYVCIHTLAKAGVSGGTVFFSSTVDPEFGKKDGRGIEPIHVYPIEGESGFEAREFVLPFYELFKPEDKKRNLRLVPFCTAGFGVIIKSAFRSDARVYEERTIAFHIMCPVTGGGVLRMSDSMIDITNSTFDPWAQPAKPRNAEMADVYTRTHRLSRSSTAEIDARRAARIAEAEANMKANQAKERPRIGGIVNTIVEKLLPKAAPALPERVEEEVIEAQAEVVEGSDVAAPEAP